MRTSGWAAASRPTCSPSRLDRQRCLRAQYVALSGSALTGQLPRRERWIKRTQDAYKLLYPYANTLYELVLLGYNVAYIFDKTASYRPWLQWLNIDIRRLSANDHVRD